MDRRGELAAGLATAAGLHVLPENAVQHVAGDVECKGFLEGCDLRKVALAARLVQLLERLIGAIDIGLVMLVVVQLHDAAGNVRLERTVVIGKIG